MTLPTAVASGVEGKPDDEVVPVRPLRAGVITGVLAALYLAVMYVAQPVPARFVRLVGGTGDEVGRHGGVRFVWQPPAGYDMRRLGAELAVHGTRVTLQRDRAVIEVGGVSAEDAHAVAAALTQKRLEFHEVLETKEMQSLATVLGIKIGDRGALAIDVEQWRPEDGSSTHTDYFLRARTREELAAALAKAHALGWTLPTGAHVAYEHFDAPDAKTGDYWRTYVVADAVGLDGADIANAYGTYDPNTNRPVVMVEMSRAGTEKFADLTTRIVGHKLATTTGDEVKSAAIVNTAIRGGRVQITMGSADPQKQEHDRDVLVNVLKAGSLPAGGTLISEDIVKPSDTPMQMWLARLVLALGGGALVGLFAWIVVRVTRPVRRRMPASPPGPWPVSRIFVTLLAPVAVYALSQLPVPTMDYEALAAVGGASTHAVFNLGMLGITPLVTAYLLSELLAVTVWRKRRHVGSAARRPIRDAFVVLAILLTALQAWMVTTYLQSIAMEDILPRTSAARFEVVAALALATAALAAVAAAIRTFGLGNGYGALIAGGWVIVLGRVVMASSVTDNVALLAQIVAVAVVVAVVLRWRVYAAGEAMLRVPTSGVVPAAYVRVMAMVVAILAWTTLSPGLVPVHELLHFLVTNRTARYAIALACVVALSAAFAWPPAIPTGTVGLARPSWGTWSRATGISIALTAAMLATLVVPGGRVRVADMVEVPIFAAFLLDAYADLRARRVALENVWTVHSAQRAELVERMLRDAGIPCHLTGANVRTILGGFGAFAPIDVLVPTEHASAARTLLSSD